MSTYMYEYKYIYIYGNINGNHVKSPKLYEA